MENQKIFNEEALLQEIIKTWGEHGAHADLFRTILNDRDNIKKDKNILTDIEVSELFEISESQAQDPYCVAKEQGQIEGFKLCRDKYGSKQSIDPKKYDAAIEIIETCKKAFERIGAKDMPQILGDALVRLRP